MTDSGHKCSTCGEKATNKCVSKTLFDNECVKYGCEEHACRCSSGQFFILSPWPDPHFEELLAEEPSYRTSVTREEAEKFLGFHIDVNVWLELIKINRGERK